MTQPHTLLPHQQALAPEYWADPRPGIMSLRDSFAYVREAWKDMRDTEIGETISQYVFHMTAGVEIVPIPEGELVPMPDTNSRQIAKIVTDSRRLRFRPFSAGLNKIDPDIIDGFDDRATSMVDTTLYFGPRAKARIPGHGHGMVVDIKRRTLYARASRNGKFLTCLASDGFDEEGEIVLPISFPMPAEVVGVPYRDSASHITRRIVSAEILEPTGMAWHRHSGDDDDRRKEPSKERASWRDWLPTPLPAPGY